MKIRKTASTIFAALKSRRNMRQEKHIEYPPIPGRLGHAHVVVVTMIDEEFDEAGAPGIHTVVGCSIQYPFDLI